MDRPDNQSLRSSTHNDGFDEHSASEQALPGSAIPYTTILEQMPDAFLALDTQWHITYLNSRALPFLQKSRAELLGRSIWEVFPQARDTPFFHCCHQARNTGKVVSCEYLSPLVNAWFHVHVSPSPEGLCVYFQDITERKQAEERLRQSEKHFRVLIENNADGIALTDTNGVLTYVSPSTTRLVGFLPEEFIGHRVFERMVYSDDREAASRLLARVFEEPGKSQVLEYRTRCKDGTFLWIEIIGINLLHEPGVEAVVWNYRDVTERKQLEQRKDHFINMASHELKTPLTILSAFTQLLHEQFAAEGRQDVVQHLSKMEAQVTNLTKLVVDLLDISRMQAGQLELALEAVDLDELVQAVVENLQSTTTHHLLIEGAAQRPIIGDRDRLGQVLIILLTNAIKYSPHADTIFVRVTRTHETLTVHVQDFGIGIAQSHQQRLFQRFYRVLSEKDKTYPGLGIGLYIAHAIIERHGGKIWVESVEGEGSTFSFSLPLQA